MSLTIDGYVETPEEKESTRLYNAGYEDGRGARSRRSDDPSYIQGYYDGMDDADDAVSDDDDYDYDYDYYD